MPRKPSKEVIEASKKHLNPIDVFTAVINDAPECSELKQALLDKGLIEEVKEDD